MHNCIFEIREDRDFTAEERNNGTMNESETLERHPDLFDYIGPLDPNLDRRSHIEGLLLSLYEGSMRLDNDNRMSFDSDACARVMCKWIRQIRSLANSLDFTQPYLSRTLRELSRAADFTDYADAYVYDPNNGNIMPARKYLTYCNECEDDHKFYVGKIWDYHI